MSAMEPYRKRVGFAGRARMRGLEFDGAVVEEGSLSLTLSLRTTRKKECAFGNGGPAWPPLQAPCSARVFSSRPGPTVPEQLGAPSIPIAQGTDLVIGGVGTVDAQPASFDLEIPAGVAIRQVLAYWEGQTFTEAEHTPSDTISINGTSVTGERVGGVTEFFETGWTATYRQDITSLGLVTNGTNSLSIDGLDFSRANDGFGIAVVVDDGSGAFPIDIRDGNDVAFDGFIFGLDRTAPVTFEFAPATADRTAKLSEFVSSVEAGRPSVISVQVDGVEVDRIVDALGDLNGPEWDALDHSVVVPAGATSVTVEVISTDDGTGRFAGNTQASLTWCLCALTLPPARPNYEGCPPWFWRSCWQGRRLWDGWCGDDITHTVKTFRGFNSTFGVSWAQSGLPGWVSLWWGLLDFRRDVRASLNREAIAALVNSDADGIDYRYSTAQVIGMYQDAIGDCAAMEATRDLFRTENRRGCDH